MILDCNEILPDRLWVGSFVHAEEVKLLQQIGITTVINLQSDDDISERGISMKKLLKAYEGADIELRRIAVQDFNKQELAENLPQCVGALEASLAPRWARVYLHCTAGINRGPTVAAAYLIRSRVMSAREARDFVVDRRHCAPYLDVLERYERALDESASGAAQEPSRGNP